MAVLYWANLALQEMWTCPSDPLQLHPRWRREEEEEEKGGSGGMVC